MGYKITYATAGKGFHPRDSKSEAELSPHMELQLQVLLAYVLQTIPAEHWRRAASDPRVRTVMTILRQQCVNPPNNDTLAAMVGVHRAHLLRLFKVETGRTPQQYALILRLEGASEELVLHHHAVDDVAARWGFSDRRHLSKMMKRHCHCTPGRLRQHDMRM